MINEALATLDDILLWAAPGSAVSLNILRLDALHPVVSGNKWFKLKYNASAGKEAGKTTLLTMGGGHSNHLAATAYAAREWGLQSLGLVRGHYTGSQKTPTLQDCEAYGMQLVPLSKVEYAAASPDVLSAKYPRAHIIPEGGANDEGLRGAGEIVKYIPHDTTDVCLAIGTGTTIKGIQFGLPAHIRLHGFYVAKDIERADTLKLPTSAPQAELFIHRVADPRFGKWAPEALDFIRQFYASTSIPLDVVYTSKMMMQVAELLKQGYFNPDARIVCIHTGGLQGNPPGLFSQ
jgi:1-aminocyclopropane-1-carboxylate deaminase